MANISFRLNKGKTTSDSTKEYSVYIRVTSGRGKDYNGSLGVKVKPDDWSSKKERIKNRANLTQRDSHNQLFDNLTAYFSEFSLELKHIPQFDYIIRVKELLKSYFNKTDASDVSFFQFLDEFIERAKINPNFKTGKLVSKSTLKGYRTTKKALMNFDKYEKRVSFSSIDMKFYYPFVNWCEEQEWSPNTIGTHIRKIKLFMREANDLELTTNLGYTHRKFIIPSIDTDEIYLNTEELQLMFDLDLSNDPITEQVRDLFCLGAYTGLRSSDYCSLSLFNIYSSDGRITLKVKMQKTGKTVIVPLKSNAKLLVEKYEKIGFPQLNGHTINLKINLVGEAVGLIEVQRYYSTNGGIEKENFKRKCDRIKSHTARRSFCSNAFLDGVNSHDIMAISGHTSEKNFLKYIKLDTEQRATKIAEHPHFN